MPHRSACVEQKEDFLAEARRPEKLAKQKNTLMKWISLRALRTFASLREIS
jgi:hypothetical protein